MNQKFTHCPFHLLLLGLQKDKIKMEFMKHQIQKYIYQKSYYFNILNSLLLLITSIYIAFFLNPKINELLNYFKYDSSKFDIYLYMHYYAKITILICICYVSLISSLFFSCVLSNIKNSLRYLRHVSVFLFLIIMFSQIIKYFLIKNNLFSYNLNINDSFYYSIYYQYLICNAASAIIISAFSFDLSNIDIKNKKLIAFIASVLFILSIPFYRMAKYYFGPTQITYIIILTTANVLLAFIEYDHQKKLIIVNQ